MPTPLSMLKIGTVAVFSTLILAVASFAVSAQTPEPRNQVTVPFDFQVGSTHLAAGTYILSNPRTAMLQVHGAKRSAFATTLREQNGAPANVSKVIFHRYGNQYFLREVWTWNSAEHMECTQSKEEQEAKRHQQGDQRAAVTAPSKVEVAMLEGAR